MMRVELPECVTFTASAITILNYVMKDNLASYNSLRMQILRRSLSFNLALCNNFKRDTAKSTPILYL